MCRFALAIAFTCVSSSTGREWPSSPCHVGSVQELSSTVSVNWSPFHAPPTMLNDRLGIQIPTKSVCSGSSNEYLSGMAYGPRSYCHPELGCFAVQPAKNIKATIVITGRTVAVCRNSLKSAMGRKLTSNQPHRPHARAPLCTHNNMIVHRDLHVPPGLDQVAG